MKQQFFYKSLSAQKASRMTRCSADVQHRQLKALLNCRFMLHVVGITGVNFILKRYERYVLAPKHIHVHGPW